MAKPGSAKRNYRAHNIMQRFGLSESAYDRILEDQGGICAICEFKPKGKDRPLVLDHNHANLLIRGFICHWCNMGLSRFKDRIDLLQAASDYLRFHPNYGKVKRTRTK